MSLKPRIASTAKYRIPAHVRAANPNFTKFVEYYYDWLYETGTLKYVQDLVESRDVDTISNLDKNVNGLFKLLPSNLKINDKALFVKHLKGFFQSKGTEDSIRVFVQALLDDNVTVSWNDKKIFKASAANYSRYAQVALEGTELVDILGTTIVQNEPHHAHATVENYVSTYANGKLVNLLTLNERSVLGTFINGSKVKYLRNTVDRTAYEVLNYYTYQGLTDIIGSTDKTLIVKVVSESNLSSYIGLVVKQVGSDARATVKTLNSSIRLGTDTFVSLVITNITGTTIDNSNELYFVNSNFEANHYTKFDWIESVVSSGITEVEIEDGGIGNIEGFDLDFYGGTGVGLMAEIGSVSGGPVEEVRVLVKGSGYEVGDVVECVQSTGYGHGFSGEVMSVDGIDAEALPVLECTGFTVRSTTGSDNITMFDGYSYGNLLLETSDGLLFESGYTAGSIVVVEGGTYDMAYPPTTLKYDGSNWSILHAGRYNVLPNTFDNQPRLSVGSGSGLKVSLYYRFLSVGIRNQGRYFTGPVTVTTENGIGQNASFVLNVVNGSLKLGTANLVPATGGSGYTKAVAIVNSVSGYGAVLQCTIGGGALTQINVIDGGYGYQAGDTVSIVGLCTTAATVANIGAGNLRHGSIRSVAIADAGQFYPDNMTGANLSLSPATSGVAATLLPVTSNGKVTGITVVDGGDGYLSSVVLSVNPTQTKATFSNSVSSNGKIVSTKIVNPGSGYYSTTEVTPLELTAPIGSGAVLIPIIDENGSINRIEVLDGGKNYVTESLVLLNQTSANPAILRVIADNAVGSIQSIRIDDGGLSYQNGTKLYVFGDGDGAQLLPIVDTGITNVVVNDGWYGYSSNSRASILDPTGNGCQLQVVVDGTTIVQINVISSGTGYTSPTLVIDNFTLLEDGAHLLFEDSSLIVKEGAIVNQATCTVQQHRGIKDVQVVAQGSGYSSAQVMIMGGGEAARVDVILDNKSGAIDSLSLLTNGTNYTSTPTVTFTDTSGHGAVSKIKINDGGINYKKIPILHIASTNGEGADLLALGKNIGRIDHVSIIEPGAAYDEVPLPIFPLSVIIQENAPFRSGESVFVERAPGKDDHILVDNYGGRLVDEDMSPIVMTENSSIYADYISSEDNAGHVLQEDGSTLVIVSRRESIVADIVIFDHSRHYMVLKPHSDTFSVISEDGDLIDTEESISFVTENSFSIAVGDVIIGSTSGARSTILETFNVSGVCKQGGSSFTDKSFTDSIGMLNSKLALLHDNERIQTHAYVLETGYSGDSYLKFVRENVHPAGYAVFGDVFIDTMAKLRSVSNVLLTDKVTIFIVSTLLLLTRNSTMTTKTYKWMEENKFWMDSNLDDSTSLSYALPYTGNTFNLLSEAGSTLKIATPPTDRLVLNVNNTNTSWSDGDFRLLTEDGWTIADGMRTYMGTDHIDPYMDLTVNIVEANPYHQIDFNMTSEIRAS